MGKAIDQAGGNGIAGEDENDRNRPRRVARGPLMPTGP
jgi:hypothetical protein